MAKMSEEVASLKEQVAELTERLNALAVTSELQKAIIASLQAQIARMPQHDPFKPIGPGPNQWPVIPQRDRIIYTSPNTAPPRIEITASAARRDA